MCKKSQGTNLENTFPPVVSVDHCSGIDFQPVNQILVAIFALCVTVTFLARIFLTSWSLDCWQAYMRGVAPSPIAFMGDTGLDGVVTAWGFGAS
jgi:hypothetical protein